MCPFDGVRFFFSILPVVPCVESEKKISEKDLLKKRGESATKK